MEIVVQNKAKNAAECANLIFQNGTSKKVRPSWQGRCFPRGGDNASLEAGKVPMQM